MTRRSLAGLALVAAFATALSCAVAEPPVGGGPDTYAAPPAMSAARMGLAPIYRGFYDALEGEGDWVLIEPYGWVFRPRVNFDSWRPYYDGWWEPSDNWGWVWNSNDSFGWITDHYGSWFYDDYQGWVWEPGPVWGPAWVAWVGVGDYVGWAPLAPVDYDGWSTVPGGIFTFAAAQQFGGMQAGAQSSFLARPPVHDTSVREFANFDRRDGVAFNRGPSFDEMRRLGSPIPIAPDAHAYRRVELRDVTPPGESQLLQRTKRLVAAGVRQLARDGLGGTVPAPGGKTPAATPPADEPPPRPRTKEAPPDTTAQPGGIHKQAPRPLHEPRRPERPPGGRGGEPDSTKG